VTPASGAGPWPRELRLNRAEQRLELTFDDGRRFSLPAELLRVESPSAEVQGHAPGAKQTVSGKRQVALTAVEPVGQYAVRLCFDDGHDSGLFTWAYLYQLGLNQDQVWRDYLAALERLGRSR